MKNSKVYFRNVLSEEEKQDLKVIDIYFLLNDGYYSINKVPNYEKVLEEVYYTDMYNRALKNEKKRKIERIIKYIKENINIMLNFIIVILLLYIILSRR